jgi:hypothetical protein
VDPTGFAPFNILENSGFDRIQYRPDRNTKQWTDIPIDDSGELKDKILKFYVEDERTEVQ